jgi:hypothetical protein
VVTDGFVVTVAVTVAIRVTVVVLVVVVGGIGIRDAVVA